MILVKLQEREREREREKLETVNMQWTVFMEIKKREVNISNIRKKMPVMFCRFRSAEINLK
jgi:hypothetical protein